MNKIGKLGEELIARWLQIQNYRILQQNWRCRWGEIDLIALEQTKKGTAKAIAFVEVKTRSQNNWDEAGLLAVDLNKQQKIIQTASLFLAQYPQLAELPCRFDVALVSYQIVPKSVSRNNLEVRQITQLNIGRAIAVQQYQFTIENYLPSAFDLSD